MLRALAVLVGIVLLLGFLYKIQADIRYIGLALVPSFISRPVVLFFKKQVVVWMYDCFCHYPIAHFRPNWQGAQYFHSQFSEYKIVNRLTHNL